MPSVRNTIPHPLRRKLRSDRAAIEQQAERVARRNQHIVEAIRAGASRSDVALESGVSRERIRQILEDAGTNGATP